jgi:uncharacterized protein YecE (DUF72 family)
VWLLRMIPSGRLGCMADLQRLRRVWIRPAAHGTQSSNVGRFPVVEVLHTFYEPPADAVLTRWRTEVLAGFEFTINAWQIVTHESNSPTCRRLKRPLSDSERGRVGAFRVTPPVLAGWRRTLECAQVLGATAVLPQCPKSFRPTANNIARLRHFTSQLTRPAARLLWEPRGEWPTRLFTELCAERDLVHVVDPMRAETVTPEQTTGRPTMGCKAPLVRGVYTPIPSYASCATWSTADRHRTQCSTTCPAQATPSGSSPCSHKRW